jgi:hypothetical protein
MPPRKAITFELTIKPRHHNAISTTKILGKYPRASLPEISDDILKKRQQDLQQYAETVEELRKWARTRQDPVFGDALRRIFLGSSRAGLPPDGKLYPCVSHFFPPRFDLKVTVCDFGDGRAERKEVRLGDIEQGTS